MQPGCPRWLCKHIGELGMPSKCPGWLLCTNLDKYECFYFIPQLLLGTGRAARAKEARHSSCFPVLFLAGVGLQLGHPLTGPALCSAAALFRKLEELEAKLVEEETAMRVQQLIDAKVAEVLGSDVVQQTLQQRLEDERRRMEGQVRQEVLMGSHISGAPWLSGSDSGWDGCVGGAEFVHAVAWNGWAHVCCWPCFCPCKRSVHLTYCRSLAAHRQRLMHGCSTQSAGLSG
jgi:hypothetical protein